MIQVKQKLEVLAKQLNLTSLNDEPEENILTTREENEVIEHAISRAKNLYRDKMLVLGDKLIDVEFKMSEMDWVGEVDVEGLLKIANSNKHYEIWLKDKKEQERIDELKRIKDLQERHTAKFFYNTMAWTSLNVYGKELVVNDSNKKLITAICFFLSNDTRFESELGYSFNKGLLVRGVSGLGKTFLFNCVKDNELSPITIYSMIELSEIVKSEGYLELPLNIGITYLDDVGTEEATINHYGTKINFFKNFIEKYYLNNTNYSRLVISTNNNFSEIENKYGFRVRSRIKDMFNIIDISGTDMRGN